MKFAVRPALQRYAVIDEKLRALTWPNASTLARELEVTPRTIHRDVDCLRDAFKAPIAFDSHRNGFYYSDPDFRLPCLSITEGEYLALFLAERLLQSYRGTPYAEGITRLFQKVTTNMTESTTIDIQHLSHAFSFRSSTLTDYDPQTLDRLHLAIRSRSTLEIVYWTASRNTTTKRLIDPYHMASIDGEWFLLAFCHHRAGVRTFSPNRIREIHDAERKFERDPKFNADEFLASGFRKMQGEGKPQTVRLRFTPSASRWINEKTWHSTQKLREHADGSVTLTFRVSHLLEVKRWVLSFGADCEVLAPKQLQIELVTEVRKMFERVNKRDESKGE